MSQTEEQRKNLYEAQRLRRQHGFAELSEDEPRGFRERAPRPLDVSKDDWDLKEEM